MNRSFWAVVVAGLTITGGACGDDGRDGEGGVGSTEPTVAPTSSAPTAPVGEARLTKEDYIREGDALCAETDKRWEAIILAQDLATEEEKIRFEEQSEAALRDMVSRFAALKGPLPDQPVADRLNGFLQQSLAKEEERVSALESGEDAAAERLEGEIDGIDRQFAQAAAQYGFMECPEVFGGAQP